MSAALVRLVIEGTKELVSRPSIYSMGVIEMNKPWPFIWIIGAVCFAAAIMMWVFSESSAEKDYSANRPAGTSIPPSSQSSGPAQQAPTIGAGGAGGDAMRGSVNTGSPATERIKP